MAWDALYLFISTTKLLRLSIYIILFTHCKNVCAVQDLQNWNCLTKATKVKKISYINKTYPDKKSPKTLFTDFNGPKGQIQIIFIF